tara:strand:+ start:6182 stop:6997 length:816 start_codon:yes stop_codon:yes gene_type:complete
MFIFTSTRILGMVSLLFLLISGGFFIVGYLAISISRSIENIIRELAEDENYIDFKKNIRDTMEELSIQIHSCINSLYSLSYKVDYSTVKIKKEQIDSDTDDDMPPLIEIIQNNLLHDSEQEDTDDDMPPLIEITQNNLLHDFEQEEVDDDTASNDELKVNPVPHCYNLRVKASNNFDNFVRPTPRVGLSYSEEQKQKEEEEEQEEEEEEEEQEEEDEGDGARFGDIINKDEESDEEEYEYNEEESDEEVVILEVEKKENEIINLIESDDEA